jgi:hypothetical protein
MKIWKIRIHVISKEILQYSFITYLLLIFSEALKPGLVSYFFNLNIVLVVVLLSGFIWVVTRNEKLDEVLFTKEHRRIKITEVWRIILFSAAAVLLVYFMTKDLGLISFVITITSAIIIILLSLLLFLDKD